MLVANPVSLPTSTCCRITKHVSATLATSMILRRSSLKERGFRKTARRNIIWAKRSLHDDFYTYLIQQPLPSRSIIWDASDKIYGKSWYRATDRTDATHIFSMASWRTRKQNRPLPLHRNTRRRYDNLVALRQKIWRASHQAFLSLQVLKRLIRQG